MAFRFRKTIKIAPGVKMNIGKKSVSTTFGGKLFRVTKSSNGTTTRSASIPGTGVYYTNRVKENTGGGGMGRKATIGLAVLAVLVVLGIGAELMRQRPEKAVNSEEIYAQCVDFISKAANSNISLSHDFQDFGDGVLLSVYLEREELLETFAAAVNGNDTTKKSVLDFADEYTNLSGNMLKYFENHGISGTYSEIQVFDSRDTKNFFLVSGNGQALYNPIQKVDKIGVEEEKEEYAKELYSSVVPGAEVSAVSSFDKVNVKIITEFPEEAPPANWEEILSGLNSVDYDNGGFLKISASIYAATGEILATSTGNKVIYTRFESKKDAEKREIATRAAQTPGVEITLNGESLIPGGKWVYISDTGSKYHGDPGCSGGNYYTVSLQEAKNRGYTACKRCG